MGPGLLLPVLPANQPQDQGLCGKGGCETQPSLLYHHIALKLQRSWGPEHENGLTSWPEFYTIRQFSCSEGPE